MTLVGAWRMHTYEDRATKITYVIDAGEVKDVPDHVAQLLVTAHPTKLYIVDPPTPRRPRQRPWIFNHTRG